MSLGRRVARLEGPLPGGCLPAWVRRLAAELAEEAGLEPAAVVRETAAVLAEAKAAGMLGSTADLVAFVAASSGRSPAVPAEAQRATAWR